jgi:HEAT repeat protein
MEIAMISLMGRLGAADPLAAASSPSDARPRVPAPMDSMASQLQQQALPDLIQSLTEKKPTQRLHLVHIAGDLHDHRASPYLVKAYEESTSEGIRCKLLQSLGKIHDPALFEWYVQRLEDPSIGIQCFAIWALGELGISQSIEPLRRKLWSPNRFVQMTAIDALGKTGRNPDTASQLIIFLGDPDVQIRFLAAKGLSGTAGHDAVPELMVRLMQEPSWDVQDALARTAGHVGGPVAAGHFIELLKNPVSQATDHWAEVGLKAADPAYVVPMIAPLLEGDDFRLKISASNILSGLELVPQRDIGADWIQLVRQWARVPAPFTREAALRLLERIDTMEQSSKEESVR